MYFHCVKIVNNSLHKTCMMYRIVYTKLSHSLLPQCGILASFPGLQSPNAVEGLVKLLRRMTSGRHYR